MNSKHNQLLQLSNNKTPLEFQKESPGLHARRHEVLEISDFIKMKPG